MTVRDLAAAVEVEQRNRLGQALRRRGKGLGDLPCAELLSDQHGDVAGDGWKLREATRLSRAELFGERLERCDVQLGVDDAADQLQIVGDIRMNLADESERP